ncbi:MAG: hypothetical protein A2535_11680 [Burkholderiales bacterium RIFOXYD2_FULL_59_8]|nr:MAG: hypothetical protein A2535_11680 [Burkholderiales bacterium RIFOXYD2_FULL_59_8]
MVDNGPGIAPDERTKVFERFYRSTATSEPGTGLGLAIVKEICDRHQIAVAIEDGPAGQGLSIELRWPRPV